MASRSEVRERLAAWAAGWLSAAELAAWAEDKTAEPSSDWALAEALFDLDLLAVHLLTSEDAPALLALLAGESDGVGDTAAIAAWSSYRDAIDLDARSRRLRRDPLYRAFCR